MKIDFLKTIYAIADALDLVGVDDYYHGKRVALMAYSCAKALNWSTEQQYHILIAGLLHDCGVSSTQMHSTLVTELESLNSELHCEKGFRLLKEMPILSEYANIIKYHHTRWEILKYLDNVGETEKLMANLIFMVDRVDMFSAKYYADQSVILHRNEIREQINAYRDTLFNSEFVDIFLNISNSESFWLQLNPNYILNFLDKFAQSQKKIYLDCISFKKIAILFAEIVDTKSHYTAEHSIGVANISKFLALNYGFSQAHSEAIEIAGYLHDLGKLVIPDGILEKNGPLTDQEKIMMSRHSFESYQILKNIHGLEQIAIWAGYHHETPEGDGYPFHVNYQELPIEARIVRIADIFQALAQTRPYRNALTADETLSKLKEIINAPKNSLEETFINIIKVHLEKTYQLALNLS